MQTERSDDKVRRSSHAPAASRPHLDPESFPRPTHAPQTTPRALRTLPALEPHSSPWTYRSEEDVREFLVSSSPSQEAEPSRPYPDRSSCPREVEAFRPASTEPSQNGTATPYQAVVPPETWVDLSGLLPEEAVQAEEAD